SPAANLPTLHNAVYEVEAVARAYTESTALVGNGATPSALAQSAAASDVIHFAGHAIANLRFPSASALALSPDSAHPDGLLPAAEISQWRLPRTRLVALSACRTAYGAIYRGEGVVSLARPFLASG